MYETISNIIGWLFDGCAPADAVAVGFCIGVVISSIYLLSCLVDGVYAWLNDSKKHEWNDIEGASFGCFCLIFLLPIGTLLLWAVGSLVLLWWQFFSILGIIVALLFIARGLIRLIKRVDKHTKDVNAHK